MGARISLAGRIVVAVDDHRVDERTLPGAQPRLVLSLLACQRQHAVTRDELADNLWPDRRPDSWQAALRGVVGRVRGFLVAAGLGDRGVVRSSAGAYVLDLSRDVWVDLEHAASQTHQAERALVAGQPSLAADLAAQARSVLARPLLPGVEAPWLDGKRRELSGLRLRALETLAEARLALGAHGHAATAAEEAIALDAFRESAHRLLIRAHAAAGNHAAGLRAYERCRRLLAVELGTDPAPETRAVHLRLLRAGVPDGPGEPAPPAPPGDEGARGRCPYQGLRTFEEADADRFFGRSADVCRMVDGLRDARLLAVVGPSGSGKSSLVRAGLLPALRRGAVPGSDTWAITVVRPGPAPLEALGELAGRSADRSPALLVVDQLEEVFTLWTDGGARRAFLEALADAATGPDGRLRVVLTLRADFYPCIADHPRLADLVASRQFLVTPMDELGLAHAVTGPARAAGLEPGEGLVEAILAGVRGQAGALPLLSHCLVEVWERRCGAVLTLAAYHDAGGVDGALAQRAEAVFERLCDREQALARRVLLRLTQPRQAAQDTRRRVPFTELLIDEGERDRLEAVVGDLVEARLLTTGGARGERWLEVSHEALITGWPRLRGWVDEDRAGLRMHRRLTAAVAEWERLGRDEGALYRGAQLAEAVTWAERHPGDANPSERAFLDASVALDASARHRRLARLRVTVAALGLGLAVVAALAVTALLERGRADEQRQLAQSRALAAEAVGQLALDPGLGLALAVEALEVAPTLEAVAALRQALVTPRPRLELPGGRRDFTLDATGTRVAIGADDGTVRAWDLRSGALTHTLEGHAGAVYVTSFSPGGDLLATTDGEGARIWDAPDGTLRHLLPHSTGVFGVAWTPAGDGLVTADPEGGVRVWDAGTGEEVATITPPRGVSHVRVAPDGRTVLAWSAIDAEVFVLDLAEAAPRAVLDGHEAPAVDAHVSPDGRYALSVGLDATARLWDLRTGEQVTVMEGFADSVWTGRFNHDGALVLLGDATGTVRVAGVPDGRVVFEHRAHGGAVIGAAFSPDGARAATVSTDGTALLWDVEAGLPGEVLKLDGAAVLGIEARSVLFTPDGRQLVTRAASVQVWDVPEGPAMTVAGHDGAVAALGLSPGGDVLATGGPDGFLRLWDLSTGAALQALELPGTAIAAVSFSGDGSEVVTANPAPSTVAETTTPPTIWGVASGRPLGRLAVPSPARPPCPRVCQTSSVAYSPDGTALLSAGQDGVVRVWDAATGELRRSLRPVEQAVRAAVFSPDGRWIAGAAWQRVPVWDAATGELAHRLPVPGLAVAFHPAGDLLAAGGDDGIVSLWEPAAGRLVAELRHSSTVTDLSFSGDGRFLVTAAGDRAVLWDVASRQRIQEFTARGGVHAVALTPADAVVIGTAAGTVSVHRCAVCGSTGELLQQAREQANRTLTSAERQRFLQEPAG